MSGVLESVKRTLRARQLPSPFVCGSVVAGMVPERTLGQNLVCLKHLQNAVPATLTIPSFATGPLKVA